jgi:hypothetical protein
VSKKGMNCIYPTDVCTRNPRQKAERGKFTGSESTTRFPRASFALRNPRVLCQKHGGTCTTYQLGVPRVQETGQEIGFPCSQERREENSK